MMKKDAVKAKKLSGRRNRPKKRRGNSRHILLFIFIGLLSIALIRTAFHFVSKMALFEVRQIIISGNQNLNAPFMEEMAYEFIGKNLYSISKQNIVAKYENVVRIKGLKITRIIPDKLKITVQERVGYAYIRTIEGSLIPIDEEMMVLDNRGFYLSEDLPVIHTSLSVNELIPGTTIKNDFIDIVFTVNEQIEKSRINSKAISEYYALKGNLYLIEASTGGRICLGNNNFEDKLQKLEFVWSNVGFEMSTTIDLRYKNQVILSPLVTTR